MQFLIDRKNKQISIKPSIVFIYPDLYSCLLGLPAGNVIRILMRHSRPRTACLNIRRLI